MTRTPDPTDIAVGRRIRDRRLQVGISQEKLGQQIGVSFQQVQKYEKGTNRVGGSRLAAIAQVLGVAVGELFPAPSEGADGVIEPLDPQAYRVARDFARIADPAMRRAIAQTIASAAGTEAA